MVWELLPSKVTLIQPQFEPAGIGKLDVFCVLMIEVEFEPPV